MAAHKSATGKIIGAIIIAIIIALALWWYFSRMPVVDLSRHGPAPSAPAVTSTKLPPIEHPISEAQTGPAPATTAPLPPLDASDDALVSALNAIPGAKGIASLLIARGLAPHLVATVDALPRHAMGASILPMHPPRGQFMVDTSGAEPVIDQQDYARYDRYMKIVEDVNSRALVTWYVHWYPLFQDAYRHLGFPHGYFNDRLIVAIDNMLAAPNVQGPVKLVKAENGLYDFADPTWQSLSVGQKLMIRMGPNHERRMKAKLRSIRALLLGEAPALRAHTPPGKPAASTTTSAQSAPSASSR